jgi:hypothetical protein
MRSRLPFGCCHAHVLAAVMVWPAAGGAAAADDAASATLARLRDAGQLSCRPALPHFCENVHVRCSGRTTVPTFEFMLRTTGATGTLELVTASEEFRQRYENANVEWDKDGGYALLWPREGPGYVKLLPDGKYVFRHYIQGLGIMSLGHCRAE